MIFVVIFALFFPNYSYFIEVMEGTVFCISDDYAGGTVVQGHYGFEVQKTVGNKKAVDVIIVVKDPNGIELLHSSQNSTGHFSFTSGAGEHSICFETKTTLLSSKRQLYMFLDVRTGLEPPTPEEEPPRENTPEKFFGSIDGKVYLFYFIFMYYIR
jgi:hypothetical protein